MTRDANEVFQYFFAIGLLLVPVFGGLERQCNQNTPIRGHLCGSNLNEVISLVCRDRGGFNNGYKKRSQIKQVGTCDHFFIISFKDIPFVSR